MCCSFQCLFKDKHMDIMVIISIILLATGVFASALVVCLLFLVLIRYEENHRQSNSIIWILVFNLTQLFGHVSLFCHSAGICVTECVTRGRNSLNSIYKSSLYQLYITTRNIWTGPVAQGAESSGCLHLVCSHCWTLEVALYMSGWRKPLFLLHLHSD